MYIKKYTNNFEYDQTYVFTREYIYAKQFYNNCDSVHEVIGSCTMYN